MPQVHFHREDVDFRLPGEQHTADWILTIAGSEGYSIESLNFIFCSDKYLHQVNVTYLDHDTFTDIITFDQSDSHNLLEGDIFISIERVKENAHQLDVKLDEELHRVIIHGVLHLMGYSDKSDEEKDRMRKKEEACLSLRTSRNNL